jgi:hypothetical protein
MGIFRYIAQGIGWEVGRQAAREGIDALKERPEEARVEKPAESSERETKAAREREKQAKKRDKEIEARLKELKKKAGG